MLSTHVTSPLSAAEWDYKLKILQIPRCPPHSGVQSSLCVRVFFASKHLTRNKLTFSLHCYDSISYNMWLRAALLVPSLTTLWRYLYYTLCCASVSSNSWHTDMYRLFSKVSIFLPNDTDQLSRTDSTLHICNISPGKRNWGISFVRRTGKAVADTYMC